MVLFAALLPVILLFPATVARSQTTVSGPIEQDTTWSAEDSPFVLVGEVLVTSNATLTIEPGVEVRGTPASSLVVEGIMLATGTAQERILFTSDTGEQDWKGIHLTLGYQSDPAPSTLSFVTIESATRAVKWGATYASANFADNILDGNRRALVFDNPRDGSLVERSVFTNNGIAVTGKTWALVGIYDSDFWNNETNLLLRPQSPFNCVQDDGVWDIHANDILRGPVNSQYFSNDLRTPAGSGVSEFAVSATDNWWGTTDDESIAARMRANFECCPAPVKKEIHFRPFSMAAHTIWEPPGEVSDPPREFEGHGDPGTITRIERPPHSTCIDRDDMRGIRGETSGALGEVEEVKLAIMRRTRGCSWWHPRRERFIRDDCAEPNWFRPTRQDGDRFHVEWSYRLPKVLRAGRYVVSATGGPESIDAGRNENSFRLIDR